MAVLEEEAGLSEPRGSSMDTNHCRTGPCVGKRAMPTVEVECVGDGGSILGGRGCCGPLTRRREGGHGGWWVGCLEWSFNRIGMRASEKSNINNETP